MKTMVSSKGQIVIPMEIRRQDRIEAGQEFEIERIDRGEYRLVRRTVGPKVVTALILRQNRFTGYFVPVESESTDTL